jgi:hypothetical protein
MPLMLSAREELRASSAPFATFSWSRISASDSRIQISDGSPWVDPNLGEYLMLYKQLRG